MRDPRAGVPWSRGRIVRRKKYSDYMKSDAWWARRVEWVNQWRERFHADPVCAVCEQPWGVHHGDLHHVSYDRLGGEKFEDLVPLCRDHHTLLHRVMESDPSWQRMGRAAATVGIITTLRRGLKERKDTQ